jgi:hypothetical protein
LRNRTRGGHGLWRRTILTQITSCRSGLWAPVVLAAGCRQNRQAGSLPYIRTGLARRHDTRFPRLTRPISARCNLPLSELNPEYEFCRRTG